jgi:hypothetical protein
VPYVIGTLVNWTTLCVCFVQIKETHTIVELCQELLELYSKSSSNYVAFETILDQAFDR